ncbi:hypothetical protein BV898_14041 [Hypsibius exemplaris]|uniref:G-protein coupled receptors family 1 profile domain-containing protein n=1 Tax=Hypsibius exemplaris TaxID=2072580 RepID=A0A1W0W918_HYPEX|nr:hypothetical protein BV898_14041 [Hypsibius exemplaris]
MNNTSASGLDNCGRTLLPGDQDPPGDHPIHLVETICYPFLFLLCTIGNILNILILKKNRSKTTADIYMTFLAISDLCILWLFFPVWIRKIAFTSLPAVESSNSSRFHVAIYIFESGLYPGLMTIFYFLSNWIVVIFSLERLLVVHNPIYFLGRFNVKTAIIAVVCVALIGTLKSFQNFLDYFFWRVAGRPLNSWPTIRAARYLWLDKWAPVQGVVTIVDPILAFCILLATNSLLVQHYL